MYAHTPLSLLDLARQAELVYNNRRHLCAHLRTQAEHEFIKLENAARRILDSACDPVPPEQMRSLYSDTANYIRRFGGSTIQP